MLKDSKKRLPAAGMRSEMLPQIQSDRVSSSIEAEARFSMEVNRACGLRVVDAA